MGDVNDLKDERKDVRSSDPFERQNCMSGSNRRLCHVVTALVLAAAAPVVGAQELEPRTYANLPVGLNFLLTGYAYSSGSVLVDPVVPLEDVQAEIHGAFIGYARALDVGGRSGKFQLVAPYALVSASGKLAGQARSREVQGFADPAVGFSIILFGAPALSPKEFSRYKQDLNIGVGFLIRAPLGQYDEERLVNVGTNRWTLRTEVGLSKAVGHWLLESSLAASFFTANRKFLVNRVREQEPIYALQLHAVYNYPSGVWVAADGTYYQGGEVTSIEGGQRTRLIGPRNSRAGVTLSVPVDRKNSIKLHGSTSVSTRTGSEFDVVGITWQHRWGAGL